MNHGKRFLISIDGGGTKTGVCVYDCLLSRGYLDECGGGNYKVHGTDAVKERIFQCLKSLVPYSDDIPNDTRFLVLGLSGCDSPKDEMIYTDMITSLGFDRKFMLICNDAEMIFRSLTDEPGICVIAGTGTVAMSFERNGCIRRSGGWGAPLSDEGSGFWIGAELIRQYLRWIDGTGPNNDIFSVFRESFSDCSPEQTAAELGSLQPDRVAEWAKAVFDHAESNSQCRQIVRTAGQKAAELAISVYKKSAFDLEQEIVIAESGSLFKNDLYENSFRKMLDQMLPKRNYSFLCSSSSPAEDGIRLAEKMIKELGSTQSPD